MMISIRQACVVALTMAAVSAATPALAQTPDEDEAAAGQPTGNRSKSGLRSDMWTAPQSPLFELSAYVAAQSWQTSYGGRDPNTTLGLTFGVLPMDWLELRAISDFSIRRESPSNLSVTNTNTYMAGGVALGFWWGLIRLEAEGNGGAIMRTAAWNDGFGASGTDVRFSPAFGFHGGVGIGLFGTAALSLKSGARFHDQRSNVLFILELSWFFGQNG